VHPDLDILKSTCVYIRIHFDPLTSKMGQSGGESASYCPRQMHLVCNFGDRRSVTCTDNAHIIRPPDIQCRRTYVLPRILLSFFSPSNLRARCKKLHENWSHVRK